MRRIAAQSLLFTCLSGWLAAVGCLGLDVVPPHKRGYPAPQRRSADYVLTRCGFHVGGRWHSLDALEPEDTLWESRSPLPEAVRRFRLGPTAGTSEEAAAPLRAQAIRRYEFSPKESDATNPLPHLEILEAREGRFRFHVLPLNPRSSGDPSRSAPVSEARGEPLARFAMEALERSLEHPRRPSPWQVPALGALLATGVPPEAERPALEERFTEVLGVLLESVDDSTRLQDLIADLLPSVRALPVSSLALLQADGRTAPRLLALSKAALEGAHTALDEMGILSLEYAGSPSLFRVAFTVCFAPAENPLLYQGLKLDGSHAVDEIRFLSRVRAVLAPARHDPDRGWLAEAP